jgi:hypothetical protein
LNGTPLAAPGIAGAAAAPRHWRSEFAIFHPGPQFPKATRLCYPEPCQAFRADRSRSQHCGMPERNAAAADSGCDGRFRRNFDGPGSAPERGLSVQRAATGRAGLPPPTLGRTPDTTSGGGTARARWGVPPVPPAG